MPKRPQRSTRKERTIRLPEDVDATLTAMADKNGHSVNAEILLALRAHIAGETEERRGRD